MLEKAMLARFYADSMKKKIPEEMNPPLFS